MNFRSSAARRALPVPPSTVYFWIIKALSTATDESTSDYRVHAVPPAAVGLDFIGFLAALAVRFRMRRYQAWTYWFAVIVAGGFAKVVADVLHVGFGVPHVVSTILASSAVAAVFLAWRRTEHTLSIHSVEDPIPPEASALVAYLFATRAEVQVGPGKWPTAGWCTSSVYQ